MSAFVIPLIEYQLRSSRLFHLSQQQQLRILVISYRMAIYIPSEIATAAAIILVAVIYLVTRKSNSLSKEKPVIADSSLGAIKNQVVGSAIEKVSILSACKFLAARHIDNPDSGTRHHSGSFRHVTCRRSLEPTQGMSAMTTHVVFLHSSPP